jgi:OOP family OmpA-OmpF porin
VVLAPAVAAADDEGAIIGGWFGPRFFNGNSELGYRDTAPDHPQLDNSIELGARIGHTFFVPWLIPEFELAFAPTSTHNNSTAQAPSILWFEPRFQLRFELLQKARAKPFIVIGGGSPISFSSAGMTFANPVCCGVGIIADGYAGIGVRVDTKRGFRLRADARVALMPGQPMHPVVAEAEFGFGVEFALGAKPVPKQPTEQVVVDPNTHDSDGDGIPDAKDQCPDRAEDFDGFEDTDGCPDIDNDRDGILDIADKCMNVPETYNGFEDEDGCPDTVPADVATLHGTIEGLLYADGETGVHDSAKPHLHKISKVLLAHPGVKVVLTGYADNREAKAFATPAPNEPPPDVAQIAVDLSRARAEAVRQVLVDDGVAAARIFVDGEGAENPVADNATPKGRLANRRVAIKLYVVQH